MVIAPRWSLYISYGMLSWWMIAFCFYPTTLMQWQYGMGSFTPKTPTTAIPQPKENASPLEQLNTETSCRMFGASIVLMMFIIQATWKGNDSSAMANVNLGMMAMWLFWAIDSIYTGYGSGYWSDPKKMNMPIYGAWMNLVLCSTMAVISALGCEWDELHFSTKKLTGKLYYGLWAMVVVGALFGIWFKAMPVSAMDTWGMGRSTYGAEQGSELAFWVSYQSICWWGNNQICCTAVLVLAMLSGCRVTAYFLNRLFLVFNLFWFSLACMMRISSESFSQTTTSTALIGTVCQQIILTSLCWLPIAEVESQPGYLNAVNKFIGIGQSNIKMGIPMQQYDESDE